MGWKESKWPGPCDKGCFLNLLGSEAHPPREAKYKEIKGGAENDRCSTSGSFSLWDSSHLYNDRVGPDGLWGLWQREQGLDAGLTWVSTPLLPLVSCVTLYPPLCLSRHISAVNRRDDTHLIGPSGGLNEAVTARPLTPRPLLLSSLPLLLRPLKSLSSLLTSHCEHPHTFLCPQWRETCPHNQ